MQLHPLLRWPLRLFLLLLALLLTLVLGFSMYAVLALPALQPWHTERLTQEFRAEAHAGLDFDGYLQREALLFEELRSRQAAWQAQEHSTERGAWGEWADSRFNPKSQVSRLAEGAPFNRSMRLGVKQPRGQALLIHGLTDSPYAMKAMAETLQAQGMAVTLLRLPGHGTLPSMMLDMDLRDWRAAVRIAAADVAKRAGPDQLFYLGGFSTGGALALLHSLDTLQDPALRRPDRVLLAAPAIELPPVAAVSNVVDVLHYLPIPLLQKTRWQELVAEYDPYKYNSFPINAGRQVFRATQALQQGLSEAAAAGRLAQMPPVLTYQSVVDATVGATGALDTLYARLPGAQHRLVLFDINRQQHLRSIVSPASQALLDRALASPRGYTLEIVSNLDPQSAAVAAQRWAPGASEASADPVSAALQPAPQWPFDQVSLGHLSLLWPPNDPIYGYMPGSGRHGVPAIGSWLLRGESGATNLSLGSLTRLRSNPFWSLIDADLRATLVADLNAKAGLAKPEESKSHAPEAARH